MEVLTASEDLTASQCGGVANGHEEDKSPAKLGIQDALNFATQTRDHVSSERSESHDLLVNCYTAVVCGFALC